MSFMFVTTSDEAPIGAGVHSIPVTEPNRRSLMNRNVNLAHRLIAEFFESKVSLDDVLQIQVESEEDPDELDDEPELFTVSSR